MLLSTSMTRRNEIEIAAKVLTIKILHLTEKREKIKKQKTKQKNRKLSGQYLLSSSEAHQAR